MLDGNITQETIGMSKEAYQLWDTTIKIGLGALISGVISYLVTMKNHTHEINKLDRTHKSESQKYKLQMKIKILENTQNQIDEFSMVCEQFLDILLTCKNRNILSCPELEKKDKLMYKKYQTTQNALSIEFGNLRKACSKLTLLGFYSSTKKIKEMSDIIVDEYNRLNKQNEIFMNNIEYNIFRDNFAQAQIEYYIAINKDFEKLQ
ncbi:hypothetical protein [Sulfurospirillum multivorans]|uniref:Uncharacterized protein n=2 Tax=Sulfurospirillum multivorans TaxID=66821 RepID=A0AA86AMP1_SULMK|nr:hypothetical protein [Sulfurospirillum multivorans]AHJ12427.1 hypothetical protein SMUL_1162 [Sulfurospirillum multivorans DSM 12446]QEH05924.1 hypothetical protein SMN_1151 [Sulfurospirillum multivorans]